jgi:hypothetical protein
MEQVRSGKMSLSKAEKLVHLPTEQQREVVAQNDRGTNVRLGKREQRRSWAGQFDAMVSQVERICTRMADLVARAEQANEWTPERKERLVLAWRDAPHWLFVETEQPKENPEPRYSMRIFEG